MAVFTRRRLNILLVAPVLLLGCSSSAAGPEVLSGSACVLPDGSFGIELELESTNQSLNFTVPVTSLGLQVQLPDSAVRATSTADVGGACDDYSGDTTEVTEGSILVVADLGESGAASSVTVTLEDVSVGEIEGSISVDAFMIDEVRSLTTG